MKKIPENREEAIKQAYNNGKENELKYHGCSQCTILAVQDVLGMRDDKILKVASGLAGGVGGMRATCGALLGASIMLGLKYGREREELNNEDKLDSSLEPVGKLYKWFEREFGSAKCLEILTKHGGGTFYDINVPWQAELAEEAKVLEKCAELVGKTAAKVVEMLWDSIERK